VKDIRPGLDGAATVTALHDDGAGASVTSLRNDGATSVTALHNGVAPSMTERRNGDGRSPRRILHVCTRFARGGSERRLRDMVAALPEHQHHVIIGRESDIDLASRQLPGVRVTLEPSLRRSVHPWWDAIALLHLRRTITEGEYELVVTHQSKAGVLGRLAARSTVAPPVVHSLSMADFGPGYSAHENRLFRTLERVLARRTAGYAVVGTDLANRFGHIGVPVEKMTIIRSAARLPAPDADRAEVRRLVAHAYSLPEDRPWILYVGSLEERKCVLDLPILLQQMIQLTAGPAPILLVAGAGPQEARLRSLARQIGLEGDCRLLGHVDDPRDLFVASDLVVLLSRAEGLPQVLVQAAAAGTPFVATDVDGADELLELGAPGKVVNVGDVVGAARAALPYLRWPVERSGPTIDLSSWSPDRVRAGYRDLVSSVLAAEQDGRRHTGRVVAVVGSDGSGKSTLSRALAESFADHRQVVHIYLGSGDGPSSLLRRPLNRIKRAVLGAKGSPARRQAVQARAPRALDASRSVWALVLAQEKRSKLRQARRAARQGALVLCDRYPQAQVPGIIDGPLLDAWLSSGSRWRQELAKWERQPYAQAHAFQPDLVIRLLVDDETAARRRPGHDPEELASRKRVVEELRFDRAALGVVEVDANRPFETVFVEAHAAMAERLLEPAAGTT